MIARTLAVSGVLLSWLLASSACAPDTGADPQASQVTVALAVVHDLEQEAIRECMAQRGFDYEPTTMSALEVPATFEDLYLLRSPDVQEVGYGALYRVLLTTFTPQGAPERPDPAELQGWSDEQHRQYVRFADAYVVALYGSSVTDDHDHDGSADHDHDGSSDEGHIHSDEISCQDIGAARVAEFTASDPTPSWSDDDTRRDLAERVKASTEFGEFADSWRTCMLERGYRLHDPDVDTIFLDLVFEYRGALNEFGRDDPNGFEAVRQVGDPGPGAVDLAWLERVASSHDRIGRLLEGEIAQAAADQACRRASADELAPTIAAIEVDVLEGG